MFYLALIEVAIRWGRFLFPCADKQHHPSKDNRRQHNLKNKLSFVCHDVLLFVLDKFRPIKLIQPVEHIAHSQAVLAWLPQTIYKLSTADAVGILLGMGGLEVYKPCIASAMSAKRAEDAACTVAAGCLEL